MISSRLANCQSASLATCSRLHAWHGIVRRRLTRAGYLVEFRVRRSRHSLERIRSPWPTKRLIVIDLQNDFCPGGALGGGRRRRDRAAGQRHDPACRPCGADAGLASRRPFELRLQPSGQAALRDDRRCPTASRRCGRITASRAAIGADFHSGPRLDQGRTGHPQGISHRHRQLFGLLRERPHDADRPRRLSAGSAASTRSPWSAWRPISASPIRRSTPSARVSRSPSGSMPAAPSTSTARWTR